MIKHTIPPKSLNPQNCSCFFHLFVDGSLLVFPQQVLPPVLLDSHRSRRSLQNILRIDQERLLVVLQQRLHIIFLQNFLELESFAIVVENISDQHLHHLLIRTLKVL